MVRAEYHDQVLDPTVRGEPSRHVQRARSAPLRGNATLATLPSSLRLSRQWSIILDNLAQGLLLCARRPEAAGRTWWIADARPYSMNRIVDTWVRRDPAAAGDYVASSLCVNRFNPDSDCNGKCYLKEQMARHDGSHHSDDGHGHALLHPTRMLQVFPPSIVLRP